MARDVPFLVNKVEVLAELLPAGIAFFEGPFRPELLVKELVNGCIGVDARARIAVPVPDAAGSSALLVDLDFVA
jgi:hypothetical protein